MTFILLILTSILIAANAQNPSSPRFVTRGESLDNIRKSEMKQYIERVDEWKAQREAYQRQAKALRDRYYDEYFEKMKDYARVVEQQRYTQLLQKQAEERAKLEQSMRYWGVGNVPNSNSEPSSPRPVDPFGSRVGFQ